LIHWYISCILVTELLSLDTFVFLRKDKNSLLLVILTLIFFASNVTATSILPCQMNMQKDSTMMSHSSHQMADQSSQLSSDDCCDKNSHCSMNGCATLALPVLFQYNHIALLSESIQHQVQFALQSFSTSLYRPPILS